MIIDILIGLAGMCVGGAGVYYWQSKIKAKLAAELQKVAKT